MAQRSRRPTPTPHLGTQPAAASVPGADHSAELRGEIQAAVDALREDYRNVFVLFHDRELAYEEIGMAVGRPVGTVKTWLHRARLLVLRQLRERGFLSEAEHVA